MSMTKKLLALLCAVALVGATACGSGDDTDDTAAQDVDAEQEATRSDDGDDVDATDDDEADEVDDADDDDADDDDADDQGGNGEFTGDLDECMELSGALMGLMFLPMVGMMGVEEEEIGELEEDMAQFGGSVPSELEGDIDVINDAFDSFMAEAGDLDVDGEMGMFDPEVAERMEAAAEELDSPEVQEAFENLEAFLEENCDFEDMNPLEMNPEDLNAEDF